MQLTLLPYTYLFQGVVIGQARRVRLDTAKKRRVPTSAAVRRSAPSPGVHQN